MDMSWSIGKHHDDVEENLSRQGFYWDGPATPVETSGGWLEEQGMYTPQEEDSTEEGVYIRLHIGDDGLVVAAYID